MSICILNGPFAIEKCISVSAAPAKWIGELFDKKRCGANKTFLLITHQYIFAPNVSSVKRGAVRTRKISANSNMVHILRCNFAPHRHMRRKASVRQYNGAGMISTQFNLRAEHVLHIYNAQILYIDAPKFYAWLGVTRYGVNQKILIKVLVFLLGYAQWCLLHK